jgi:hypothetical protein
MALSQSDLSSAECRFEDCQVTGTQAPPGVVMRYLLGLQPVSSR